MPHGEIKKKVFKWKKLALTIFSLSFSFTVGYQSNNFYTTYINPTHPPIIQEQRIAIPLDNNDLSGAYVTVPISQLDSLKAARKDRTEDGSNIDRKYGGRR